MSSANAGGQDQVGGLHVAVNDRRFLRMQMRERVGRFGEVCQHARGREPRLPTVAQQRRQVGAVNPVHRQDVVIAVEEILADKRQRRMRWNREQDPPAPR
ncbi:MAG: hypothetical protein ABSH51_11050 [Solirubrobacteraceae bacterium]